MKVIFLALAFPKMDRNKYLYSQLVSQFHDNGHDITVVAPAYDETLTGLQIEEGVKVIRVKTLPLFGVGLIKKGIANILLPYQYKNALKKHDVGLDFDLIMTPTPPISLYGVAAWLKNKSKGKLYLILRDIFPQNAVDLGMLKKSGPIHFYFRRKEKKLYNTSDQIGCMSEGNIDFVKKHNPELDASKLHMLPNWGDIVPPAETSKIDELRKKEGFENKFIVIFGGNIGLPQKMENIVNLALACKAQKDILFLIMGKGNESENLQNLITEKKPENLQLRDGLPQKEYMLWVQMADVGLISLSEKFTIPNIPSKALSYYNTKTPILASIDRNTDFGKILDELNVGVWAEAGNTAALKEKLMLLYKNDQLRREMGQNGFNYMKEHLSANIAFNTIIEKTS
ncbi:glycosyltransferase family 4 protein [Maribacter sp. 2308TA10-17]|uniref:glycosyltransferase family 4 protein n=1 Tax=Maribacter sp. 2308TA10-17 TaxID=3386276 RepID=UPI0039BCAE83